MLLIRYTSHHQQQSSLNDAFPAQFLPDFVALISPPLELQFARFQDRKPQLSRQLRACRFVLRTPSLKNGTRAPNSVSRRTPTERDGWEETRKPPPARPAPPPAAPRSSALSRAGDTGSIGWMEPGITGYMHSWHTQGDGCDRLSPAEGNLNHGPKTWLNSRVPPRDRIYRDVAYRVCRLNVRFMAQAGVRLYYPSHFQKR